MTTTANDNAPALKSFEVGKAYWTRSACDHDCIFSFMVIGRTAKQVTLRSRDGSVIKRGIQVYDNEEHFKPFGSYSMCAIVGAGKQG